MATEVLAEEVSRVVSRNTVDFVPITVVYITVSLSSAK